MQKVEVKNVRLFKIRPNIVGEVIKMEMSVVEKEVDFSQDAISMLETYHSNIECDTIDMTSFGGIQNPEGYTVIVDDEGLLKSDNVVLEYKLPIGDKVATLELAGTILIGKSDYVEGREDDGLYEVGLTDKDIEYINNNIEMRLLGITR